MANKVERLQFTRKRLVTDIKHQVETIEKFDSTTSAAVLLSRKEALEELWSDFRANMMSFETARDWIGTDDVISENTEVRELYLKALAKLTEIMPDDVNKLHESMIRFQGRAGTSKKSASNKSKKKGVTPSTADKTAHKTAVDASEAHDALNEGSNEDESESSGGEIGSDSDEFDSQTESSDGETSVIGQQSSTLRPSRRMHAGLSATVKLPPLPVKLFSGSLLEWPEFKGTCEGTFTSIMDETNRFRYLKSHLAGEPAKIVQHLPLKKGSYKRAMELLTKRYDNPRAIINANFRRLFGLAAPNAESLEFLRDMLNKTNECIATLNGYNIRTKSWDSILIFILSQRLDANSIQHWEEKIQGRKTVPKLSEFTDFLDIRISILETTASTQSMLSIAKKDTRHRVLVATTSTRKCTICGSNHFAFTCPQLTSHPVGERIPFIANKGLCVNCLFNHDVSNCKSKYSCRHCNERHNTVLHPPTQVNNLMVCEATIPTEPEELQALEMQEEIIAHVHNNSDVFLATAIVRIEYGTQVIFARALIDQGATANLISERLVNILCSPRSKVGIPIKSICGTVACTVNNKTVVCVRSRKTSDLFNLQVPCLIVPKITSLSESQENNNWPHLGKLELADPNWHKGGRIDILLGSAVHSEIIIDGLRKGFSGQPMAQNTKLGWIVSGGNGGQKNITSVFTVTSSNDDLSKSLQRFWESEEIPKKRILTPEEQMAEDFFIKTTRRCSDGRFMVKLPFKNEMPSFGESKKIAKRRYEGTVKRLSAQPELRATYDQGIQEYLDLGHMELVDESHWPHNYLPHHPVIKDSSTTTKVRAVYDASCKTSNGNSLNSQLLVGPTIQPDLFSLLINWRKGKYAITGDIEKMYRQIWLDPEHTEFQRIL